METKMTDPDVRWKQRFQNYSRALAQLTEAVRLIEQRPLSNIEKQGFIKAFEFTHELAWNVMKDYFVYQGDTKIMGSRDATREAYQKNLISEGEQWMEMIKTRNKAVHTYDESIVADIVNRTTEGYYPLFLSFEKTMKALFDA